MHSYIKSAKPISSFCHYVPTLKTKFLPATIPDYVFSCTCKFVNK